MADTLTIDRLCKSYGRKKVVCDISFEMTSGQIVGLLGPNGAGKTTTFYMIVGFIRSDSGRILLNGTNITRLPMYKRSRLGISYLPQEASIFRKLSVWDNIALVSETRDDL
ncbi:MAG: ATP-binding cassette domain-containing protein, partial [Sphaerochaetaceae bacterium]|nr:ATP-binding cassette domain-containing protein [Sphaerochaetaceae bacterium]